MKNDIFKKSFICAIMQNSVSIDVLYAGVSELADETDSKSVVSNGVRVRVPPPAFFLLLF